jgi:AAA+ ATPase superfamily predicted ATPase
MFFFFFDFYGRERELEELNSLYKKDGFKFVVVYGRRRVGKSSLIQKFIDEDKKPNISFMAFEQNDKQNLDGFSEIVINKYGAAKSYLSSFSSWDKALEYIIDQAGKERLVVFIDEYPYIANSNASISSVLQKYIDGALKATNITLILCGSSMSFMETQVLGHKSPLYGRRDMQFKIEPFDYYDSARFFDKWSNEDKALAYAVTGGIPQYLNKLKAYDNIADGIKNEFLKKNGSLYEEPRNLLMQELREPAVYNAIIRAIAGGASKPNDIATKAGEESKKVSKYLITLISLHLVKKELPMFNTQERNGVYTVCDNLFRFWYKFVIENNMNIESGITDYIYEQKIMPELPNYMGHIFEDISIQFLKKLNKTMTLPFIFDDIGRWWGNNPIGKCQEEIDIIAISKNSAIFGECKWKNSVGIEVLENLKRKADLFKQFEKKYYYLFAKGTFTKALQDIAKQDDSVKLITLKDIYSN